MVCLHEGGGPQVGDEVTRLGGVTHLSILSLTCSPHLSFKLDQIKGKWDTPIKQVTPGVPNLQLNRPILLALTNEEPDSK